MNAKPNTIKSSKGRTLYLRPDGGYETSKARRQRREDLLRRLDRAELLRRLDATS